MNDGKDKILNFNPKRPYRLISFMMHLLRNTNLIYGFVSLEAAFGGWMFIKIGGCPGIDSCALKAKNYCLPRLTHFRLNPYFANPIHRKSVDFLHVRLSQRISNGQSGLNDEFPIQNPALTFH
jgi:hypothetical protein